MPGSDWISEASDEELVEALCDVESGLTAWEVTFVESVTEWVKTNCRPLTREPSRGGKSQRQTAEEIMRKIEER